MLAYQNGRTYIVNGRMCLCSVRYLALAIKANSIMREIQITEKGENFTTVNV